MAGYDPPSNLRIPLAALVGLLVPPLGLALWIAFSGSNRRDYLRSTWVRGGFALAAGSALPLLAVGAAASLGLTSDPNPNPIGLGFLFLLGAGLGTVIAAVGVLLVNRDAP